MELRDRHEAWMTDADPRRIVCIDEAGSTIAMTRTHGRSHKGQ
jgi:hypothetical protein